MKAKEVEQEDEAFSSNKFPSAPRIRKTH